MIGLRAGPTEEIAGREHVHPGHLEIGGVDAAAISRIAASEPIG